MRRYRLRVTVRRLMAGVALVAVFLGIRQSLIPAGFVLTVVNGSDAPIDQVRIREGGKFLTVGRLTPGSRERLYCPSRSLSRKRKAELMIDCTDAQRKTWRGNFAVAIRIDRYQPVVRVEIKDVGGRKDIYVGGLEDRPLPPVARILRLCFFVS